MGRVLLYLPSYQVEPGCLLPHIMLAIGHSPVVEFGAGFSLIPLSLTPVHILYPFPFLVLLNNHFLRGQFVFQQFHLGVRNFSAQTISGMARQIHPINAQPVLAHGQLRFAPYDQNTLPSALQVLP